MSDRETRLAESLTALAPAGGGDWSDVVARSNAIGSAQHRRRVLTIAIAFAAFLVCTGTTLAVGNQLFGWFRVSTPSGWFKVETAKSKAPATKGTLAYIAGQTLYRPHKRPQRLAYPLRPMFSDDNLVVSSPDGRYIVYQAVRSQRKEPGPSFVPPSVVPMLYVHDTIARREKLLARGAMSAAWNRDGRIAYFKADHERYEERNGSYVGQVVVQTLDGTPTVWTRRAARYRVLAWARGELLVEVVLCYLANCRNTPASGVYALKPSGRLRPLHLATVAALSPDGRYALGHGNIPNADRYSPIVRLVRIDTGRTVTTLNPTRLLRRAVKGPRNGGMSVLGYASWRGSEIVGSLFGGDHGLLAIFRRRGQTLEHESNFRLPARIGRRLRYAPSFGAPFFSGPANERIVVTVHADYENFLVVLVCSRATRSCVRGKPFARASLWSRQHTAFDLVDNPSRPLADPRSAGAGSP